MADSAKCRNCGQEIWFAISKRTGGKYPINSEGNPRDLHQCRQKPAPPAEPIEESLAARVASLEAQVPALANRIAALKAKEPITNEDVPF